MVVCAYVGKLGVYPLDLLRYCARKLPCGVLCSLGGLGVDYIRHRLCAAAVPASVQKRTLCALSGQRLPCAELYCSVSHAKTKIDPGTYELSTNYDYRALVKKMQVGSGAMVTTKVTIPEGYTMEQIFHKLEDENVCSYDDLMDAAANYSYNYSFIDQSMQRSLGKTLNRLSSLPRPLMRETATVVSPTTGMES